MTGTRHAAIVAFVVTSQPAFAHDIIPGVGGFIGGLLHALLVPAHLMSLAGLALLAARQVNGRHVAEAIFALALIGGLAAIALGTGETTAPLVLLGLSALCGLLAAAALPVPRPITWLVAAATGVAVGLDSPPDVISIRMAYVIMFGTWLGAVGVLVLVAEAAARLRRPWQLIGQR